ncbi:ATP-dependent RNA helicase rok1 [Neofusicoccum parvum]|nr:ATP-dependent RNA helicase rok1 [Neofusicoccum parvum]
MDFLKLLSRGTNVAKGATRNAPAAKTPSSGANLNPQLFGRDTPQIEQTAASNTQSKTKKRKRGQNTTAATVDLPPELDFFGDAKREDKDAESQGAAADTEQGKSRDTEKETEGEIVGGEQPVTEEDCKRILRSHKVKITLLEDYRAQEAEEKAAKRKSKKRKKEQVQEPAQKKNKVQLFPQPLTSFGQLRSRFNISRKLAENINAQGYTMPTEVQLSSLPLLLEASGPESNGIDLLTVAPTGSGKTLAFLIPVIESLLRRPVKYLVLDEADVLLDPLFRQQTLDIWNACTSPLLRVSLWSATMGSNIEELAKNTISSRWNSIEVPDATRPNLVRLIVGLKDSAVPNIDHQLTYAATEQGKLLAVRQLLHPTTSKRDNTTPTLRPPFLIFTQTIPRAQALYSELQYDIPPEAGGSSRIAVLHSSLSSSLRDNVMARFRRGEVWVLITTDLLARGVDFRGINGVVNYDVPTSGAAYVHRAGRTGRAGREGGVAVTLYTEEDVPYIRNIANVIRASEALRGEERTVKQWLLDALPTPSKRDKKELKRRGVEARRAGVERQEGRGRWRTTISTKSGYERKVEHNRKAAVEASRRRGGKAGGGDKGGESEGEFGGFDD